MLESIREAGRNLGRELERAWEGLSEGWRELLSRSGSALTSFAGQNRQAEGEVAKSDVVPVDFPRWSLLAGEVEETATDLVVRIEVPGMSKDDCCISIDGNVLRLSGEKHYVRETGDSTYHVMERAYGAFERSVPLPRNVDADKAAANYRDGVLTVRLPKTGVTAARSVAIT